MEWVETTGRTVEEAKDAALDQLGVDETDAEFVVVSEPKAGLFGRMRGEARVRARVRPTAPRPKRGRTRRSNEGRSRRSSSQGGGTRQGGSTVTAVIDDDEDEETPVSSNGTAPTRANGASSGQGGSSGTGTGTGARKRRRRGGRGRGSGSGQGAANRTASTAGESAAESQAPTGSSSGQGSNTKRPSRPAEAGREEVVGETLSLQEQGETAQEFISGLVRELGLQAEVSVQTVDDDTVEVAGTGQELGILVGPGVATLQALQELARTVVQKRTGGHSERILVDVAGYRARRAEALRKFTQKVATEVVAESAERALEPMNAADRKVVHDTVNEIDGVSTRSEGEEPRRYIVIAPTTAAAADGDS